MSLEMLNNPTVCASLAPQFGTLGCTTFLLNNMNVTEPIQDIPGIKNKTNQLSYDEDLEQTLIVGALKTTGNVIAYCNEETPLDLGVEIAALKSTDAALISDVALLYTLVSTDTQTFVSDIALVHSLVSDVAALQEADASLVSDIAAVTSTVIINYTSLSSDIAYLTTVDEALATSVVSLSSDVAVLNLLTPTFKPDQIADSETSTGAARYLLSSGVSGGSLLWIKPQKLSWLFNSSSSGVSLSITNSTIPALASGFPSTANITLVIDIGALTGNEWPVGYKNAAVSGTWYSQLTGSGTCPYYMTYEVTGTGASSGNFGGTNSTTNNFGLSSVPPMYAYTGANGTVFASSLDNTSVITIRLFMKTSSGSTNTISSLSTASFAGLISAA